MAEIFLCGCLELGISACSYVPDCKWLELQGALQMGLAVTLQLLKLSQLDNDRPLLPDASFCLACK